MRMLYCLLCVALVAGLAGITPAAESTAADSAAVETTQVPSLSTPEEDGLRRPFLRAERTAVPPIIDDNLTDEVWALGAPIRDLFVDQPVEGDPLPQRTEIRILYDDDALYFAAWCYDTEPDEITASLMRRDASPRNQDFIMILLDPFGERRSGYVFAVTPIATRWDSLIEEAGSVNQEWDGIWYAQAGRNGEGWVVEIAIPFKSLNFPADRSTWGFNIARGISRYNQTGRWANALQHAFLFDPGYFGDLGSLEGLDQGLGIDAVLALALRQIPIVVGITDASHRSRAAWADRAMPRPLLCDDLVTIPQAVHDTFGTVPGRPKGPDSGAEVSLGVTWGVPRGALDIVAGQPPPPLLQGSRDRSGGSWTTRA